MLFLQFLLLLFVLFCFVLFFDTIILFLFIYLFFCSDINECVRRLHKCSSGAFATIPKVHTIAHANMDSREMDENVKVVVRSINNYVVKK